jgi:hypothetical protein
LTLKFGENNANLDNLQ